MFRNGFVYGLGAALIPPMFLPWRKYAPETDHERRMRVNVTARGALLSWFRRPDSFRARETFIEVARGSVQFRRLMLRYGLNGNGPMNFEDIAKADRVNRKVATRSIEAALASLPVLSTAVEHSGLRAIAAQTVKLAAEDKFVEQNELGDGPVDPVYSEKANVDWNDPAIRHTLSSVVEVRSDGEVWASDRDGRASLMDAYTDGWIARFEEAKDTSCPFRNRKLRKKWYQGYREAAQELAARRKASISTS